MREKTPFLPESAADALRQWDQEDGLPINAVELGGIGPSYEQAIYITIFELLRDMLRPDAPSLPCDGEGFGAWGETTLKRINPYLGLSGSQWGMARQFAAQVLSKGWLAVVEDLLNKDPSRLICICRRFPSLPAEATR